MNLFRKDVWTHPTEDDGRDERAERHQQTFSQQVEAIEPDELSEHRWQIFAKSVARYKESHAQTHQPEYPSELFALVALTFSDTVIDK